MSETLSILPFPFWATLGLLAGGLIWAVFKIRTGIGLPIIAVLGTVTAWYVGDVFYNDYRGDYLTLFADDALQAAWWEVALFVAAFLIGCQLLHPLVNARYQYQSSQVFNILEAGAALPSYQTALTQLFGACFFGWVILCIIATIRLKSQILYFFFPFLAYQAEPWGRDRIGSGFDALLSLANYLQLFMAAIFGVTAASSLKPSVIRLALLGCLTSWPYYIFGRARNSMLAMAVPAVLALVFLRLRGGMAQKLMTLGAAFLAIHLWFGFVISNRSSGGISEALHNEDASLTESAEAHHEGLNMYEELCWINTFLKDGSYQPNMGRRYFAELVNPVPRSLWHGKPMIGIDYAIARGMAQQAGAAAEGAGVNATISTGMIGQGVVNFGPVGGPIAAAFLMSLWVCWLARIDLREQELGRIPLFMMGSILTFNMGRDITLLVLYPFVFGCLVIWWLNRRHQPPPVSRRRNRRPGAAESSETVSLSSPQVLPGDTGAAPGAPASKA